jgi:uncharacterized protein involved in exopolysaccharide biosynthesis
MANELIEIQRFERRSLPTLRDIASVIFRQRGLILAVFVAVIAIFALSGGWVRKYQAHMKIIVLRQRTDSIVTTGASAPSQDAAAITEEDLNSEVELLKSEDLLRNVVVSLNLQRRSWTQLGRFNEQTAIASAVNRLAKDLDVQPVRKTDVIEVKYSSTDPQLAARVLDAVSAAYLEKHRVVRHPSGEFRFFDQQAEQFRRGLEQAQARLGEFSNKSGVVSAQLERDLTLQRLADFDATAHQAQASADETAQRIRSIQSQLSAMQPRLTTAVRTGENPQLMQQLKATLLNLQLKRTELLTKYDPSYALVREVDKEIDETTSAISSEQRKPPQEETTDQDPTYSLLRSELAKEQEDLRGLKARAVAIRSVAAEYRETARNLEQRGITQNDLERVEKTEEENYLLYQKKREEARISDALDQRGILNVAMAEPPSVPALPTQSPAKTSAITLALAFFVSFSAGFIADYSDPSFRTPDEVVAYLDLPVLASLPKRNTEA